MADTNVPVAERVPVSPPRDAPRSPVGANVRRLRGQLSQDELARRLGWSQALISQVETDRWEPSFEKLHQLATALGTTVADLYAQHHPAN